MKIGTILKNLNLKTKSRAASPISSSQAFHEILTKERARSDRNGHGFSVASFSLGKNFVDHQLDSLLQILNDKIRATDNIGWLNDNTVGVLLYNTPLDGAWEFIKNVRVFIDKNNIPHSCDVLIYPNDWSTFEKEEGQNENSHKNDIEDTNHNANARNAEFLSKFFVKNDPAWKRLQDIVFSSIAIVILSPIMLAAAIAVKLTSDGPVLYKQKRAGLNGEPFACLKFRSMCVNAEEMKEQLWQHNERTGPVFKMSDDPRITPIGKFIRKWSIDELPQLFNVFVGDMSLVGPRPPSMDEVEKYHRWHNYRLDIKPGITCIWQVYARHNKSFEDWVRLDIEYVKKQSFLLDFKLLFMTIPAVLSRKGAC